MGMINDAPGPINFTMLLTMFAERQSGGSDEDDVVINAFKSFDDGEGHIDGESLRHALMTWGDKFTSKEVDDAFESMVIDSENKIDTQKLIEMLTAAPAEEEAEAAKATSFHCTFNVSSPRCYLPKNIFFLFFFFLFLFVSLFILYGTFVVVSGG